MATELQKQLALLCGADIAGLSKRAAAAALRVALADELLDIAPEKDTTKNQNEIARQLSLEALSPHMEIAALQIEAEFVRLNEEALEKYSFEPGMRVRFVGGPNVHGHSHEIGAEYVVSTVKADGRIYFKATNGASAYANQLEPIA